MLFRPFLSLSFLALFVLGGCAFGTDSDDADSAKPRMEINVQLRDEHRCSVISPEIQVINAPQGTTGYTVRVIERKGKEEVLLGEGFWNADGSGIIPEGILTGYYRGPCPEGGLSRHFVFEVQAKAGKNPHPLATAFQTFILE